MGKALVHRLPRVLCAGTSVETDEHACAGDAPDARLLAAATAHLAARRGEDPVLRHWIRLRDHHVSLAKERGERIQPRRELAAARSADPLSQHCVLSL